MKTLIFILTFIGLQSWMMPALAAHSKEFSHDNVINRELTLEFKSSFEIDRDELDEMDTLIIQNGRPISEKSLDFSKSWCKVTVEHWPEVDQDRMRIPAGTKISFSKPVVEEREKTIATNYVSKTGRYIERARCFRARKESYLGHSNSLPVFEPVMAKSDIESVFAGSTSVSLQ